MKDYHINVFYSDEDDGYIADIPDLKHCSAFGETPEEALCEALKAKEAWLEAARSHNDTGPTFSPVDLSACVSQMNDPTVEEVRKARDNHARRFNYDLSAICEDIRRHQEDCGHPVVTLRRKKNKECGFGCKSIG